MAKYLRMDNSVKETIKNQILQLIETAELGSDISYKYSADIELKNKLDVFFTPDAYAKMQSLVENAKEEIGWHGTVTKLESGFLITDILVYPQTVTSVTVRTDESKYAKWLMKLDDDIVNSMHFQGHSHVNMGVSPSSTDLDLYANMLTTLPDNGYYIFFIVNKRDNIYAEIYDMEANIKYETKDINIAILLDTGISIDDWYKNATENTVEKQVHISTQIKTTDGTPKFEWYRWSKVLKKAIYMCTTSKKLYEQTELNNNKKYKALSKEDVKLVMEEMAHKESEYWRRY